MNALALGMAYALVALGFVLALNASGAVNFAHGDLVVLGGVWLLLERTQIGRRRRAVAADRQMARAPSGALAGVAGLLLGHQFLVSPTQGAGYMLTAYIAVALGGWGSVPGAPVGALVKLSRRGMPPPAIGPRPAASRAIRA